MAKKYKIKTHKGTAKRLRITATGKIMRKKQQMRNNSHLKSKRKSSRALNPEAMIISSKGNVKRVRRLLNI